MWVALIATLYLLSRRNPRSFRPILWTVLAITSTAPIEALYDRVFALQYSSEFANILPNVPLPLVIPFAYGTLYGLLVAAAIVVLRRLPRAKWWIVAPVLLAIMLILNFAQEGLTTSSAAWVYHWPAFTFGPGSRQPWIVPVGVAVNLPLFYFAHRYAEKTSADFKSGAARAVFHFGMVWIATLAIFLVNWLILSAYLAIVGIHLPVPGY